MGFLDLFIVSLIAVLKVLLVTAVGLFLSMDRINLLGRNVTRDLNNLAFFVFNPALILSSLSETITFQTFTTLWFMPVNLSFTVIIGSMLAWILIKVTQTPAHLQGLVVGSCSCGNHIFLLIIVQAICEDSKSPFGHSSVCSTQGKAYGSLSFAVSTFYIWTYLYAIMSIYANKSIADTITAKNDSALGIQTSGEIPSEILSESCNTPLLSSTACPSSESVVSFPNKMTDRFRKVTAEINLKLVFTPSTIAVIVGCVIGIVSPVRKAMIGDSAPLRVIDNSLSLLGDAAIPSITLVLGANLLNGLRGSRMSILLIIGIIVVRYIILPLLGVLIVKGAHYFGMIGSNSFYHFVLLLQFAVPPPISVGTISQLHDVSVSESSVILLWTYAVASIALTLWTTFYLWLLA
ncbi:Auxin efflux carrier family protein [Melia azedarach]|uniref:Auxin efflux carrier family protein n=1 Tax=Melia azedarach TaxID=155640 RepID=A0ACC1XX24_MELAZ|nr:Auxin efflux carrier family protein [Melia azedarach]